MKTDYARKLADTVMRRFPRADQYPYRSWCYPQGYLLIAFSRLWEAAEDRRYWDYIHEYCDMHVAPDGQISGFSGNSMDDMMAGSILVWMYEQTGEEKYKKACRRIYEAFSDYPRTREGGFLHGRNSTLGQMWVDGVFMGQMFYCRYGRTFQEPSCFDETGRQLELIYRYCYSHDGLLLHAYSQDCLADWAGTDGRSSCVWSEGLGWYALILSEVIDLVPQDHPTSVIAKRQLLELLEGLRKVQDESGLWYQVVDRPGDEDNWCDVSGSAMFAYAIWHALKLGLAGEAEYRQILERAYEGIGSRIRQNEDGLWDVYGSCDGLCVQKNYDAYVHYPQVVNGKEAVCGCLWAAVAMEWGQ
ncbi:MAG TPA: glycoside hydrolase family 88 protein [Candidatus Eisenbergiella merdavium]|uniref:Glycoside hydrolase family 88 protein n=1 Tax=Candidatus Eisenbergiella merdavium TaxID=2838551 RepID=A0A9D2NJW1_9FIRM|nr:glycoside hydrolase family 88 protein [Candidatus Eisenbergiella merdavium]